MVQYVLAFCRIIIGLVFAWSFMGKVQDISSFTQTIDHFKLLPETLHRPIAVVFLGGELVVLGIMVVGGKLLIWGFLLAGLLLTLFSIGLISVLIRKIQTPCNCFGSSRKLISPFDVIRNTILLLFSFSGYTLLTMTSGSSANLGLLDWGLVSTMAIVFVITLIQLDDIIKLFR